MSRHALEELEHNNKTIDFVGELLENGKHQLASKKKNKYEVTLKKGKIIWKMVYVIHEKKVVIIRLGVGERL